ncbi:secondary metabolism biosynthetic enzyme [Penicillium antarcticum]|nr:secondary metabolism biosynthetic enzyme [Penicillium antarcticum]KAJ5312366.1 secondary metabolism biosynthetic enzyme [Penicillium antarcticum]
MTSTITSAIITPVYSRSEFLNDIKKIANATNAAYSESSTVAVLNVFEDYFRNEVIIFRATDRPGDALNYRLFIHKNVDTLSMAKEGKLLDPEHQMLTPLEIWCSLYQNEPQQWCDFDANAGLVKTWLHLVALRPVKELLTAPGIPSTLQSHLPTLQGLGFNMVWFVSVDYHKNTLNIYFLVQGDLSKDQADQITGLAGSEPPTKTEFEDIQKLIDPRGYFVAVTMRYPEATIPRVAFYALNLLPDQVPIKEGPLRQFLDVCPSYDERPAAVLAWSFGQGGDTYKKLELGYAGEFGDSMRATAMRAAECFAQGN